MILLMKLPGHCLLQSMQNLSPFVNCQMLLNDGVVYVVLTVLLGGRILL